MTEKLRVLALHGYRQNAEIFRRKVQPLIDELSVWIKFIFVNAPHEVYLVDSLDNPTLEEQISKKQYGWFFNRNNLTNRGIRNGGPAVGFQETVTFLESIYEAYGPFDGILGFSQGACLAALLCDLQQRGLIKTKFNFAIIISGFKSNSLPHLKYFGDIIRLPSLHIIGDNDTIIPVEMSELLANNFQDSIIVRHAGGHVVPLDSEDIKKYKKFLYNQYVSKNNT